MMLPFNDYLYIFAMTGQVCMAMTQRELPSRSYLPSLPTQMSKGPP